MCYALCCPPPSYVFSYDFQQVARQVAAVLSAGKSDVSQAAAQASISLLWCACTSRPIDLFVQDGLGNAIAPYEESAARGTCRVDFQRLAPYANPSWPSGIDKGVTFNDFHDRIMNFGKKQVKGGKKILNKCSRCFQCFYCSKDCQTEHWKKKGGGGGGHKAACLELRHQDRRTCEQVNGQQQRNRCTPNCSQQNRFDSIRHCTKLFESQRHQVRRTCEPLNFARKRNRNGCTLLFCDLRS